MENQNNVIEAVQIDTKRLKIPRLVGIACAALLVLCMFLPLFVVTEEYADYFDYYPDDYIDESVGLNIHELESISVVDYGRIYRKIYEGRLEGTIFIAIAAVTAGAAVLTLLFALLNKPIGVIIFDIPCFSTFRGIVYDLTNREIVPSSRWEWGVSYYLTHVVAVALFAVAVWMMVAKWKAKRQKRLYDQHQ